MDPTAFDAMVRSLTTGGTRRRLLGVLSALPLVGTALAASDEDTAAKGKGKRKRHKQRQAVKPASQQPDTQATSCAKRCRTKSSKPARRRCRKRCQTPPECTTSADCPAGELCESGVCLPVPDQCTTNADCDACERCDRGVCVAQCQPDQVCRNNQCETVQCQVESDCGDCSRCVDGRCRWQCAVTEVCLSGAGGRCCQPRSCPAGLDCGTVDDGCGGQAQCGTCTEPQTCEGSGTPNQCGCTPTTCAAQGAQCDSIGDGCGGTLDCGLCPPAPTICLRSRCAANQCVLEPVNDGLSCDDGDACTTGSTCHNGTCKNGTTICTNPPACRTTEGATCTGGTCTYPQAPVGTTCDTEPCGTCNGAGRCVGCPPPETCGGGNPGTPGVCGCTPTTCVAQGKNCGTMPDGCGGTLNCGSCSACATCESNVCTPIASLNHTCSGPCPSGEWCDAGVCASIQATVRIPDCQGLCNGTAVVCSQTVTCPDCGLCDSQTGCLSSRLAYDGPVGSGLYCASTAFGAGQPCPQKTNAECPSGLYCIDSGNDLCAHICPF